LQIFPQYFINSGNGGANSEDLALLFGWATVTKLR
jgi:hypothetical protein